MPKNNDQIQYDQWWSKFISTNIEDPGTTYRTNLVINEIKSLGAENIVDGGCGSAELIKKILDNIPRVTLSGFDVSQKIIDINKEKYPNVNFFTLNLNEESSPGKKFGMVICCEVIEHLRNWQKAIGNLAKLVENNGYLLITTQAGKMYKHHKALDHLKHFEKEKIENELKKYGLKIVKSRYSGWPFMNIKNILLSIFFKDIKNSSLLTAKKQSMVNRIIFRIFKHLYNISSRKKGPQIFILAKKESE